MEPTNHNNTLTAAELGSCGGQKRMEQLSAQEITYLVYLAIKNGK